MGSQTKCLNIEMFNYIVNMNYRHFLKSYIIQLVFHSLFPNTPIYLFS